MLLSISAWWQALILFEKIFWLIAMLFSTLFLLQTLLALFGGHGHDLSGDADGAISHDHGVGHQFFTLKNLIAFFTLFGWTGIAAYHGGASKTVTILMAIASGVVVVLLMAVIFRNISRLKHNGAMQITNALNKTGNTYLVIPAKRGGLGKVHIKIQGTLQELSAMTDDEESIATGKLIRVKNIINDRILLVTLAENALY